MWKQGTVITMSGSTLELQRWHPSSVKIISFWGHSQVGQALGNYVWHWVPHPHMYTPTLCEYGTVIRMSGSALEPYRGGILKLYANNFIWGSLTCWPGNGELCVALGSPSSHVHTYSYPVGTGNCHQNVWIWFRTYRGGIHPQWRIMYCFNMFELIFTHAGYLYMYMTEQSFVS